MRAIPVIGLLLLGCGSVQSPASADAAAADSSSTSDAAASDVATPDADLGPHLIFVTSTVHDCALGGLTGADAICQARAQAANLPGTYKAWLSTGQMNGTPLARFTHAMVPYVKVDGVQVADNWMDLTDGTIDSPINTTETGGPAPVGDMTCQLNSVWSNTLPSGAVFNANNSCNNWTSINVGGAHWGYSTSTSGTWTSACSVGQNGFCFVSAPIYCFQQ